MSIELYVPKLEIRTRKIDHYYASLDENTFSVLIDRDQKDPIRYFRCFYGCS